jgi:hypothetical protein
MNRNRKKAKGNRMRLRVYTHAEALGVLPYLASVLRSLREHRLEANRQQLTARRLAERPGRPDRDTILAQQHAGAEAQRAEERFNEAQQEMHCLDVYDLDAVGGLALIPFVHDNQLAWFIYDLYDNQPLRFWRYQSDPLETRRLVTDALKGRGENSLVV